jgi:hypothetical protein
MRSATRIALSGALVLALGLTGAGMASALDFCMPATDAFLKGFKIPHNGKCVNVKGTYGLAGRTDGTACTDTAGTHTSFSLHSTYPPFAVYDDYVDLSLPAISGVYYGTDTYTINYGSVNGPIPEGASYCATQPVSKDGPKPK